MSASICRNTIRLPTKYEAYLNAWQPALYEEYISSPQSVSRADNDDILSWNLRRSN